MDWQLVGLVSGSLALLCGMVVTVATMSHRAGLIGIVGGIVAVACLVF